jgi:hypothetical protein
MGAIKNPKGEQTLALEQKKLAEQAKGAAAAAPQRPPMQTRTSSCNVVVLCKDVTA